MEGFDKTKFLPIFKEEVNERIYKITQGLLVMEQSKPTAEIIYGLQREAHNIKGSSRILGLLDISEAAHSLEDALASFSAPQEPPTPANINEAFSKLDLLKKAIDDLGKEEKPARKQQEFLRVPLGRIDKISILSCYIKEGIGRFKENLEALQNIVLSLTNIKDKAVSEELKSGLGTLLNELSENQVNLANLLEQTQTNLNKLRLVPLSVLLEDLPRLVRDISVKESKEAEVSLQLGAVGIDRLIAEEVKTIIIHTVNNAVRHGIELPQDRQKLNKTTKGTIRISASLKANRVFITVEDDGRGLNIQLIKSAALEKKIIPESQIYKMSPAQIRRLILLPGFSTSGSVDTLSGRGMGLDAVRESMERLGGGIDIESEERAFCRFIFSVPLTIGTTPTIMFKSAGQFFAVPILFVQKTLKINAADIANNSFQLGDYSIAVVKLKEFLHLPVTDREGQAPEAIVIIDCAGKSFGLATEEILEERELLLRSFGDFLGKVKYLSGAAILPEGKICLILDIPEISGALYRGT